MTRYVTHGRCYILKTLKGAASLRTLITKAKYTTMSQKMYGFSFWVQNREGGTGGILMGFL